MITFTKSMFKGAVAATAMMAGTMASAETLTMSSWVPPTHFIHTDVLVPFTEKVAEVTEGRVNVMILPAPLASPPQHLRNRSASLLYPWKSDTHIES